MPYDAIVSDWHGCLTSERDDFYFWKDVAYGIARRCIWPPRWLIILRMLRGKSKMMHLLEQFEKGEKDYADLYREFNNIVLKGIKLDFVHEIIKKYAQSKKTQDKMQKDLVQAIVKNTKGKFFGIISVGYKFAIEQALGPVKNSVNEIDANEISTNKGRIKGFVLNIYKNKGKRLLEMRKRNGIKGNIVVIGNAREDEAMFQQPKVVPVVSNLASDEFKEYCKKKYRARFLKNPQDLENILRSI